MGSLEHHQQGAEVDQSVLGVHLGAPVQQQVYGTVYALHNPGLQVVEDSQFYGDVAQGIRWQCRQAQQPVAFRPFTESVVAEIWQLHGQGKLRGLLLLGASITNGFVVKARQARISLVLVDHWFDDLTVDTIVSDNTGGVRSVMQYLFSLGHQRIGFVGGPLSHPSLGARFKAFQDTMVAAGLFPGHHWCRIRDKAGSDWSKGSDALFEMVRQGLDVSALVCDNDHTAVGVIRACQQLGIDVPNELSVVGFDDIPKATQLFPAVTTMRVPREAMGRWAAKRLLEPKADDEIPVTITVPTSLVIRESTGPGE